MVAVEKLEVSDASVDDSAPSSTLIRFGAVDVVEGLGVVLQLPHITGQIAVTDSVPTVVQDTRLNTSVHIAGSCFPLHSTGDAAVEEVGIDLNDPIVVGRMLSALVAVRDGSTLDAGKVVDRFGGGVHRLQDRLHIACHDS